LEEGREFPAHRDGFAITWIAVNTRRAAPGSEGVKAAQFRPIATDRGAAYTVSRALAALPVAQEAIWLKIVAMAAATPDPAGANWQRRFRR
jgi:hypothetical protein